jgi:5,6,7,8-tetrahydromethanopterin hydro-lyase
VQVGESFVGTGESSAHVNVVLGARDGPVATAWATALATPSAGHTPFVVVAKPGLPVQPFTLFVNKATITDDRHAKLTWGAAQAGVAAGVIDALEAEVLTVPGDLLLIVAVWVDPKASDEQAVYANNREATYGALSLAIAGLPSEDEVIDAKDEVWNPFFRPQAQPAAPPAAAPPAAAPPAAPPPAAPPPA